MCVRMGRGKSEGRGCPRTREASHLVRLVPRGVSAGPGGRRPGPGPGGLRASPASGSPSRACRRAQTPVEIEPRVGCRAGPRPHLPSTVSGPTTDGARFPKGKAVRPSRPFPEHLLRVGWVSAPAAVGAVGANQACPAPHTGNLMMSPRHRRAAVMCCSSRSQGWAPGCVCRGWAGSPDRLVRGWGAGV